MEDDLPTTKKVITLGPTAIGKTCILERIANNRYEEDTKSSIGVNNYSVSVEVNYAKIKLNLWDTAGQEKYAKMNEAYIRNSDVVLICYDPDETSTINQYYAQVIEYCPSAGIILVATKDDLYSEEKNQLFNQQSKELQEKYHASEILKVSSKTADNISALINIIATTTKTEQIHKSDLPVKLKPNSNKSSGCC